MPHDRDEILWAAMESGKIDDTLKDDTELAGDFAAYQKLESLFEVLREPAGAESQEGGDHPTTIGRYRVRSVQGDRDNGENEQEWAKSSLLFS